jgi:hypothetical protein
MSWVITGRQVDAADADARAYLAAVEAADTQALEPAVRLAVDAFVIGCKADGIWTAIKASCILAGARTRLGALVPLKGTAPTSFNFVDADYNRKTGLVGDGSTKYLDSNRNNNADPQNSNHNGVYATAIAAAEGTFIAGNTTAATGMNFLVGGQSAQIFSRNRSLSGTGQGVAPLPGFLAHSRSASGSYSLRFNNSSATVNVSSDGINAGTVKIFRRDSTLFYGAHRLAFYSIGESLDLALLDARVTDLINAFAAAIP